MKVLSVLLVFCALSLSQSIVRIYCGRMSDLTKIEPKIDLDIASARAGEWYDIVADYPVMDRVIASGLPYDVRVYNLDELRDRARRSYHSYPVIINILRSLAAGNPSICKLDSLPVKTFQNRWIYALKISDNPYIEEESEPGMLVDGCHHAREWATIEIVLYFANYLVSHYASSSEIRNIVDNCEIYCVPVVNVDGYIYDYNGYGQYLFWRKNREPFEGTIGTDCNRNYGCCAEDPGGNWGAVDSMKANHYATSEIFCGPCTYSGNEIQGLTRYVRSRVINSYMSYHSSGEVLMWGWGFTKTAIPDSEIVRRFGNRMAGMIDRVDSGTYSPGQVSSIMYYTSGASQDWVYSWMHWLGGVANLSYVTEAGVGFYPEEELGNICINNFKALKYLAQLTRDSIPVLCEGAVAPPQIYDIDTVGADFTVSWHPVNPTENHPLAWELVEYSDLSVVSDSLESGADRWVLDGFALSSACAHSGSYSLFSGDMASQNSCATSDHPCYVHNGDSLVFWCYYNLEQGRDVAVVEVSENRREWFMVDTLRYTGQQLFWQKQAYSLDRWSGVSIYIRFRAMYDNGIQCGGFFIDDIWPACRFGAVNSIGQNITDTLYQFTGHSPGTYYYQVRGRNATWDWGIFSPLKPADVLLGVAEKPFSPAADIASYMLLSPNPVRDRLKIRFGVADQRLSIREQGATIRIYNTAGILVKTIKTPISPTGLPTSVSWDLRDSRGQDVPNGVYYITLTAGDLIKKASVLVIK